MSAIKALPRKGDDKSIEAQRYAKQAERLGLEHADANGGDSVSAEALEAKFVTPQDPVIETAGGARLPAVPVHEALKLNELKDRVENKDPAAREIPDSNIREAKDGTIHGIQPDPSAASSDPKATLSIAVPPAKTNPLFPPLPVYGPPSLLRNLQSWAFRFSAAVLSFGFLLIIILGAVFTSVPLVFRYILIRLQGGDPDARRPFYHLEKARQKSRREEEQIWKKQARRKVDSSQDERPDEEATVDEQTYTPLEGGPDPLVCDAKYYARRVGLDIEEFRVQTEDGFYIKLWHLYNPKGFKSMPPIPSIEKSADASRDEFDANCRYNNETGTRHQEGERRYPVLLIHGLLQSGGAFCCTDDNSLAFFLVKSGFDVWIGNNRCGVEPEHELLRYGNPRMWAWNIRQMGVMDLPSFVCRVLKETGFEKLGLVCHSQGTTQTLVALAKEQRPDIGEKISVFCALAPAAYAGPLITKAYFKFMQVITPTMFRMVFGIHAFIPLMMRMHRTLPGRFYGAIGYRLFSFLFNWSDDRWDQDLRNRMFQFSPVYVSSESMRWWLGREGFARQKCILSTRDEWELEDKEDREEDELNEAQDNDENHAMPIERVCRCNGHSHKDHGRYAWYDSRAPPFAFWVAGNDELVDGKRLLRRFERGREPHVSIVHSKVIDDYEHLDVIWAIDVLETVGNDLRQVLWKTAPANARRICRTPTGCDNVEQWKREPDTAPPAASPPAQAKNE